MTIDKGNILMLGQKYRERLLNQYYSKTCEAVRAR